MNTGVWQFKPRLLPSLVTLFVFPALLALGFWQMDRAEHKRTLYAESIKYRDRPPMILNEQEKDRLQKEELFWRPVLARGRFDNSNILVLDNRISEGEAGYFVFIPFHITGTSMTILVNRGWIRAGNNRRKIPAITTPEQEVSIKGVTKDVPSTGIFLGDNAVEKISENVFRLQRIHISEIEHLLGDPLLPVVLRLGPESAYGFKQEWQQPGSGEEKHLGYAFQWFALAATLLVIYVVVNCKKTAEKDD